MLPPDLAAGNMVRANRLALRKFDGGDRPLSIVSPIEIRKPWNLSSQTFSTVPAFPSVRTTALPTSSDWASSNGLRIIDGLTSLKRPFADAFVLMPFGIPEKSTVMAKRIAARTCGTEQSALLADLEQRAVDPAVLARMLEVTTQRLAVHRNAALRFLVSHLLPQLIVPGDCAATA